MKANEQKPAERKFDVEAAKKMFGDSRFDIQGIVRAKGLEACDEIDRQAYEIKLIKEANSALAKKCTELDEDNAEFEYGIRAFEANAIVQNEAYLKLEAENAELKAALKDIENFKWKTCNDIITIAEKALKGEK